MSIYQPAALALTQQLALDITASQREHQDTADAQLIGAILADIGDPLSAETIAGALAWTVDRVLDASGGLRTQLQQVGQIVTISANHDLALASHADAVSGELRTDLHTAAIRIDDTAARTAAPNHHRTPRRPGREHAQRQGTTDRHTHDRRRDPHRAPRRAPSQRRTRPRARQPADLGAALVTPDLRIGDINPAEPVTSMLRPTARCNQPFGSLRVYV
jgi:hypothetical protein